MTHTSTRCLALSLSGALAGLSVACDQDPGVGSPCAVDEDCGAALICDVHDGQGTCQQDHGHEEDTDESACEAETRDDEFAVGLGKAGTWVTATFVSADPAPPARADNSWVLSFADSDGAPLDGLAIAATPTMPDHGHGTPIEAVVTATGAAGEYRVAPINLFMVGYWEIALDVTWGEQQDSVTFGFCVE